MNFSKLIFIFLGVVLIIIVSIFFVKSSSNNRNLSAPISPNKNEIGISIIGEINDLKGALDPRIIPDMVKGYYKDGVYKRLVGQKLVEYVMQELQRGVEEISMIDLDSDGNADQIYIVPSGNHEHLFLSIRVPDPLKVRTLPNDGSRTSIKIMQDIAENKSIEVVLVKVTPKWINLNLNTIQTLIRIIHPQIDL